MPTTRVRVSTHGFFFTGDAKAEVRRFMDRGKETIARRGEQEIRARLGSVLKNPTGYYESQIRVERTGQFNDQVIHDGGVIYGPWLESGKYTPPRRFRGYRTFRRVRTKLRKQVTALVQADLDRLISRLNG